MIAQKNQTFCAFSCICPKFLVPSNICLGFYLHTITSLLKPFGSPVRLSPAIGVMSGAHYQSSIQELLHLVATFAQCSPYYRTLAFFCSTSRAPTSLCSPTSKVLSPNAAHTTERSHFFKKSVDTFCNTILLAHL